MTSRAKLTNKLIALLAIVLLAFSSVFYLSQAYGTNTRDEKFQFDLDSRRKTAGTAPREKHNSTSVYVHVKSMTMEHCSLHVDGSKGYNGPFTDRTIGGKAMLYKPGKYRIRNLVHERGETYCRLTAFKTDGSGQIIGVWSPDCAGTYTPLN